MAKRKDAIALFEVMRTGSKKAESAAEAVDRMNDPARAQVAPQAPAQQAAPPVDVPPAATPVPPAAAPVRVPRVGGARPMRHWLSSGEPIYRADGEGFAIRLSQAGWVVAAAVLVIVLACAFAGGRWSVRPPQQQGQADSGTELVSPAGAPDLGPMPLPPPLSADKAENWYLVIQDMQGKDPKLEKDAKALVEFLKSAGYPAKAYQFKGGSMHYFVRSEKGFASQSDPQALKYAEEIEALPKKYTIPGGYNFAQDGKPWFISGEK